METIVIGLVGSHGVGKTTVAEHIERRCHGQTQIYTPLLSLRKLAQQIPLQDWRDTLSEIRRCLEVRWGDQAIARRIAARIKRKILREKFPIIVIDGVQTEAEAQVFRQEFPNFTLLCIEAKRDTRLEFIRRRAETRRDKRMDRSEITRLDQLWSQRDVLKLAPSADYVISNHGTLDKLLDRTEEVIQLAGVSARLNSTG